MKITRPFGIGNPMFGYGRMLNVVASAACTVCMIVECQGQGTMTFTFEGQPPGSISGAMAYYVESGMQFNVLPDGGLFLVGPGVPGYPQDGSGYLIVPDSFPGGGGLEFNFTPAALFNLVSLDAARVAEDPTLPTIEVVGYVNNIMVTAVGEKGPEMVESKCPMLRDGKHPQHVEAASDHWITGTGLESAAYRPGDRV
jgi:hypothetical protein